MAGSGGCEGPRLLLWCLVMPWHHQGGVMASVLSPVVRSAAPPVRPGLWLCTETLRPWVWMCRTSSRCARRTLGQCAPASAHNQGAPLNPGLGDGPRDVPSGGGATTSREVIHEHARHTQGATGTPVLTHTPRLEIVLTVHRECPLGPRPLCYNQKQTGAYT